jgi:DNA-binding NarL/FixJ family response regulator
MSKYRVAYIDESDPDIRRFQRFASNYFEVIPFKPNKEIELTVAAIIEAKVDAVIADFDLGEQDVTIHYSGAELVSLILEERDFFPVFILTSYEDEAVSQGDDVNIVYEKSEMANGEKFLERVKTQIEKYYNKLDEAEKKLLTLIEKGQQTQLDAQEEKELEELDSLIEKSLNKKIVVPDKIKKDAEEDKLGALLKKVDELAKKLEQKP